MAGLLSLSLGCAGKAEPVGLAGSEIVVPALTPSDEVKIQEVRLTRDGARLELHYRLGEKAAVIWSRSQLILRDETTGQIFPLETPSPIGSDYLMPASGKGGVLVFKNLNRMVKPGSWVTVRLGTARARLIVVSP